MSLPRERLRALKQAEQFLTDLLDHKTTPKVPKHIRIRAKWVLRHYPFSYELDSIAKKAKGILSE